MFLHKLKKNPNSGSCAIVSHNNTAHIGQVTLALCLLQPYPDAGNHISRKHGTKQFIANVCSAELSVPVDFVRQESVGKAVGKCAL